jgi:hypothetical protein
VCVRSYFFYIIFFTQFRIPEHFRVRVTTIIPGLSGKISTKYDGSGPWTEPCILPGSPALREGGRGPEKGQEEHGDKLLGWKVWKSGELNGCGIGKLRAQQR